MECSPNLFNFLLNSQLYNTITAGNFGGPFDPYTEFYYGTRNFHWWLNNPYRMAGIPTGVYHDYRQTIACGAGPLKTYSFDTHRIVGGVDAARNAWPGIVSLYSQHNSFTATILTTVEFSPGGAAI